MIPQKLHSAYMKLTLLQFEVDMVLGKDLENLGYMLDVGFGISEEDEDVIDVDNYKAI